MIELFIVCGIAMVCFAAAAVAVVVKAILSVVALVRDGHWFAAVMLSVLAAWMTSTIIF